MPFSSINLRHLLLASAILPAALLMSGCGGTQGFSSTPVIIISYTGVTFAGTVKAGATPIVGSSVQLYAAGTTGNGSAPTALLASAVLSSSTGAFTIPAAYNCPSSTSLVYLLASGGTVGTGSANSNISLLTALGPCGSITANSAVVIDEVTTVAAVYALSPFYAKSAKIGASSTNFVGLTNAFATAATLANPATGTAPGVTLPSNATAPTTRVNSLANLLNTCVAAVSGCPAFYAALGVTATNTLDALAILPASPATRTSAIYSAAVTSTAYTPALSAAPTDYTLFLKFSGGGMDSPTALAIDSTGAVWVASYNNVASKFSATGAAVFASGVTGEGLYNSYGIAVDLNNNAWVANEQPYLGPGTGTVSEISSTGTSLAGGGYAAGGMNYPIAVAIDPNGTTWVVQYGNSHVSLLNSSGTPLSGTNGYTTASFAFPVSVAIDSNHFGWIGDQNDANVTKVAPDGSSFTAYACCDGASGIAIDQSNNVWVANFYGNSVSMISAAGKIVSNGAYTGLGSINHAQSIAIDGAGTVWVANYRAAYLTELAGASATVPGAAISPAAGLGADSALLEAYSLAIDASGSIWVSSPPNNTITKFIGLATPVKTPLSGIPKLP